MGRRGRRGELSTVFVVCRSGSCAASGHYDHVAEQPCTRGSCALSSSRGSARQVPQLSRDGAQVFFAETERDYVAWTPGAGLRQLRTAAPPGAGVLGAPLLAPDGSLRVVRGRHRGTRCELTLLTSDPLRQVTRRLLLTEQATTAAPTTTGVCATTLEAFTGDQLLVHTDRRTPAYFVRAGHRWRPTSEDPTGLVRYPRILAGHPTARLTRTGLWHGREVAVGSPDRRRLVAQVHFPGTPRWTRPVTVAVGPAGFFCSPYLAPTPNPSRDPFYVSLECRHRPTPTADFVYVGEHALTDDGRRWQSTMGDQDPTRVGTDLFFGGTPAHRWTSESGLTTAGPPVPANSRTFLLQDGTMVLVTAGPVGARCRLVVRVARTSDRPWSAPVPGRTPWVPAGEPCAPVGQSEGAVVRLYFHWDHEWLPAAVERVDGVWTVLPRRRVG